MAFAVRLAIVFGLQLHQDPFRWEARRVAESLIISGVYGNPYLLPTGPTAHASAPQVLLMAAVFHVTGIGVEGELALYVLNALLAAIVYAAIP